MKRVALVVLPTYNERSNIEQVLTWLFALNSQDSTPYHVQVLVVDDNSPDGTGEYVQSLIDNKADDLYMITGKKNGLGSAYLRGFEYALDTFDFEVIVQMDADLSHDPNELPLLLEQIAAGNDVAIGSRFTEGGLIPGSWPMIRLVNSKVAHFVARYVGGIETKTAELTGGFKAIKRSALESIDFTTAKLNGYGIQLFLSNEFVHHNFKVAEVPISFRDRKFGESKITVGDAIEFILIAWSLNYDSPLKRLLRFMLIGAFGVLNVVGMAQLAAASTLPLNAAAAIALGVVSTMPLLLLEQRSSISSNRVQRIVFNIVFVALMTPFIAGIISLSNLNVVTAIVVGLIVGSFWYLARLTGLIRPARKIVGV